MIEVVSREVAKVRGLPRYFDRPCCYGHYDGRFTSTGACVGCHREAIKRNRKKWPEKERALKKRLNVRHKEKIADYDSRRYLRDGVKIRARVKRWQSDHPEKVRGHVRKRRAASKCAHGSRTIDDIDRIFLAQKGRCAYFIFCGKSLRSDYWVDHIAPLSKGGSDNPSNIQLTCPTCNMRKGTVDPVVFARRIGMLV